MITLKLLKDDNYTDNNYCFTFKETKMNYKIGQVVVVTDDDHETWVHNFDKGDRVEIIKIVETGDQTILARLTNTHRTQWLDITQIRPDFDVYLKEIEL